MRGLRGTCGNSNARHDNFSSNDSLGGGLGLRFATASNRVRRVERTESVRRGLPPPRTSRFTLFPPAGCSLRGLGRPHRLAKGSDLAAHGFCVRRHKRPQPCAHAAPAPTAFTDGAHGYPEAVTNCCSACFPQVRRVVHRYNLRTGLDLRHGAEFREEPAA